MRIKNFLSHIFPEQTSHPHHQKNELWGYWIAHAETLRWLMVLLVLAVLFLSGAVIFATRKPPVVVRVDQIGNAVVIRDLEANNAPSDIEIAAFAKDFLRAYLEVNSLTFHKDFARALNLMTKKFQAAHLRDLKAQNFVQKITRAGIQTQAEFKDMNITSRMPTRIYLDVRGITSTTPLEDPHAPPTKRGFIARLTIAQVPRTERTPNGLLVEDYRQHIVPLEEMMGPQKVLPESTGSKAP